MAQAEQETGIGGTIMEVVPMVMRRIRMEMRSNRMPGLTVPQLRSLIFLYRHEGASLSQVADHVGLSLPSMSKTIDVLVTRKLVTRRVLPRDRRYVRLGLSAKGRETLEEARKETGARIEDAVAVLSAQQRAKVVEALHLLRPLFTRQPDAER